MHAFTNCHPSKLRRSACCSTHGILLTRVCVTAVSRCIVLNLRGKFKSVWYRIYNMCQKCICKGKGTSLWTPRHTTGSFQSHLHTKTSSFKSHSHWDEQNIKCQFCIQAYWSEKSSRQSFYVWRIKVGIS